MNRKLTIIVLIQAFIIIMLFWVLVFYGKDEYEAMTQPDEEEIEIPNRVSAKDGQTVIQVPEETQIQSEIKTSPLASISYSENVLSYGNVVSLADLIQLKTQLITTQAEKAVLENALIASKKDFERFNTLNQDDKNISDKVVQIAFNDMKSNEAKLAASAQNAKNIADQIRQQWGNQMAHLATGAVSSTIFKQLLQNERVLIQISLPFSAHEPLKNSQIQIAPTSALSQKTAANYFSPAPTSNLSMQGKTYFYTAKADFLRAGMPIKVLDFNQAAKPSEGVLIPNSAVVWYAGKPWVYFKQSATEFKRLPINNDFEMDAGWFYQGELKANDAVVTSGAQLLLSEEFKSQITNENDD